MKKGQKVERGQPIPFIMIDENIEGNQVNYNFRIDPKSFQIFNSEAVKNKKVAIAAIAGPQRTGKSFLSNRLLKKMKGFAIGPTTMPCTKGLWIWGQPIQINKDTVLIIMDTQGLNSVQRDINVDLKIFSLSILLSSVFIYNSIGHIDQKALQNMSYVLRISQNLKISSDNDSDNQISKYFPYFYWVLRDFTLDLKGMSESDYLEESLKAVSHDEKDPKNQIRSKIRKLFAHRKCQCFPRPVHQQDKLAHIQQLKYQDLRDAFKKKMDNFQRSFYSNLPVKVISGKPVTGQIYLNLAHQFVNAMNSGKVPKIKTSFENVITSEIRKACESYQNSYKMAMDKLMSEDKMPLDQKQLEQNYKHFVSSIQRKFQQKFRHYHQSQIFQTAKSKFTQWLILDYKNRFQKNSKMAQVRCQKHLSKIFEEIKIPNLTSSQNLTTSLVAQKSQQFNKKLKDYFQKEKTPKKFSVFAQKFPKYIFGYFGQMIAKVKGIYTEQINLLKRQTRQCRNQIDSVKRVSQQQDNLLLQIRREAATLTDQKQQYQKKIKMQQQMISIYDQTQSGNKNSLKKKVQQYQRQIMELHEQNNQLSQKQQKLRSEISKLREKSKKQITPIAQQNNQKKWDEDRTPNQVVKTLKNLQNKLDIMNEFYEKKVQDDTIDQILKKQIEQMMTDKYNSIQKARQDFKTKNEQLKKKHNKVKENYDRKIQVLSKHLDDIKRANIDLEKKNNEGPGSESRIRGLLNERKKFEQSLRQKQSTLNSEKGINENQKKKIEVLELQISEMQGKYAIVSAENANLRSYPETFNYILRESLYLVLNKNNKLQHSLKSLDPEDKEMIKKTLSEVGVKL